MVNKMWKKFAPVFCICVMAALSLTACDEHPVKGAAVASAGSNKAEPSLKMWVRYPEPRQALSEVAVLGKQIFFDTSLSASGKQACSSCHSPEHAFGPPDGKAVQPGGSDMKHAGTRAVPSLRYMAFTPKFTRHYAMPSPDGVEDEGPTGGFARDGAADSLHEQARLPFFNVNEMANADNKALSDRLRHAAYAGEFQRLYGPAVFENPEDAVARATLALEAFESEDPSFQPYTSKFDSAMSGNAMFSEAELRGYTLFNNPAKGNCAKCHFDSPGPGGRPAQFTDYGFEAVGVPRNPEIPANSDSRFVDLGLCGPARQDLKKELRYCGMFKTPTLRNVSTREVFFHNGRFHKMEDVLRFYVERDTHPDKWYPVRGGKTKVFDDLPTALQENVDHVNAPFNRKKGDAPAMDDAEIADLIAFLKTLDDGYSVHSGAAKGM
jgi:cytochrome c peroxidase